MFFKFIFKRKRKDSKIINENKYDMKSWMELTKQERYDLDTREKEVKMKNKKALLKTIREEYTKINKIN